MRASLFQKAIPESRKSLDENDAATSKEVSSDTWAFSSMVENGVFKRLHLQWKEAVNQSFFGITDSDGAAHAGAAQREHGTAPDHAAASHPPHTSNSNTTIHHGPFMEDSLRALRRGLLAQMQVQQSTLANSTTSTAHDSGAGVKGTAFSLMLDMGHEMADTDGGEARGGDDGAPAGGGGSRPVLFVAHDPLVFACLRHSLNIPDSEYREAFMDEGFQALKPATSKSGRSFYMTKDDRFILKSLSRAEADFLLEVLCHYFEHVAKHPSTLLPRFCGLYEVSEKGRDVVICIEANAFSSQCPIHERYDLKGSVVGRMTREEDKAKDGKVILKDLDLTRQLPVGGLYRSLLLMQLKSDCQFLESLEIVDYSLLLGVHNPKRLEQQQAEAAVAAVSAAAAAAGAAGARRSGDEEATPASKPPASSMPVAGVKPPPAASPQPPPPHPLPNDASQVGDTRAEREEPSLGGNEPSLAAVEVTDEQPRRGRADSFGTGKKPHWTAGLPAGEGEAEQDMGAAGEDDDLEACQWRYVDMLQSSDFDSKITFNPNKVLVVLVAAGDGNCAALCRKAVTVLEKALGDFMCNLWEEEPAHSNASSNTAATHPSAPAHEGDRDFVARGHMRSAARGPPVQPPALPVQGRVLNLDTCSPLLVQSLRVFNVPCTLCFSAGIETERLIGAASLRTMTDALHRICQAPNHSPACVLSHAAGPSIPVLRKDWNGVEGAEGDVFYFGIVDVLQPYNLKKQLEHSLKSLVQDKQKMTIVEPGLYSQRFQAYISSILV